MPVQLGSILTAMVTPFDASGRVDEDATVRLINHLLDHGSDGLVVAIGDGANDLPMLESADVSVAYHAKPVVRARTSYAIDYCGLDAVLNLFH